MKFLFEFCGKKIVFVLFLTSFVALLLDLFSIALIFPFLKIFIEPGLLQSNKLLQKAYNLLGCTSPSTFLYNLGFALMTVYIIKLVLKTSINKIKFHASNNVTFRLSKHLFDGLLMARYSLFTEESTSEMINIVNAQTVHSVICLESVIRIANEAAFLFIIMVAFIWYNPYVSLFSILSLIFIGFLLYITLVKKIEAFGKIHAHLNVLVYKYGFAMANSIKDIKIMRLEKSYSHIFSQIWENYSDNDSKSKTAKNIPTDISETFVFSGIICACLYILAAGLDVLHMVPILGVVAVTSMRVLPSFNRIVSSYNEYRFYKPALVLVQNLFHKIETYKQEIEHVKLAFDKSLEIKDLSFSYCENKVLDSISLKLDKGGSYAFVGASGAGKSTLLDVLVGLRESADGEFLLDGVAFDPFRTDALRSLVGYVPQNVNLIDETVAFNISFEIDYDREKMQRVISIARLSDFVGSLQEGLETVLGESGVRVSGGQKQRIGIARALYRDPAVLIFDEATSALDTITERELMAEINQLSKEKTLIIVAHRLSTVEHCDVIHLLDKGRIIARGTQSELIQSSAEYRALYCQQEKAEYETLS